jgi:hypothetical protein
MIPSPFSSSIPGTARTLENLCCDDAEALKTVTEAVTNTLGTNQHTEGRSNRTTLRGTTREYALRKLSEDAPEIYQRVVDGELSPHAAISQKRLRAGCTYNRNARYSTVTDGF